MVLGVFTNLCNCQTTHCRCDVQRGIAWQLSSNNMLHPTGAVNRQFRVSGSPSAPTGELFRSVMGGRELATDIEKFLYGNLATHGVTEFTLSQGVVRLRLAPWAGRIVHTIAVFRDARITSVEVYATDPGDLDPPWDIIGFDGEDLGESRWRFVLHCDAIEWCFESAWPEVVRADAEPGTGATRSR